MCIYIFFFVKRNVSLSHDSDEICKKKKIQKKKTLKISLINVF